MKVSDLEGSVRIRDAIDGLVSHGYKLSHVQRDAITRLAVERQRDYRDQRISVIQSLERLVNVCAVVQLAIDEITREGFGGLWPTEE